ncbi:Deoxyuridine 5'-triphosphate nucleotidohydrolase [Spathaspora passalidarum NRRL Y-27907]|uniref:Deoxyuridine 5'-triphosphate nucleotidohydrolase n=1 Tax=Spathaspora passalidarum (strain NRRL Y-27907 / 11-Y1) TaxID=619300 RepID=G3ADX7_SPAPN|nr:Deoxyuridine 5'-triphosphate nucleotidohydrolase [Spathaspora passalidarum NRRL Y-27907]EGW34701.1 Deoxyuridine 5'-triphosphate nucleotidohydrolase [Spathaspora passalidarum NRRL Y-27907]
MTTQIEQIAKKQKIVTDTLRVFLRSPKAKLPTKGSALAAGYDIYSSESAVIPAHGQGLVSTDISVVVPIGTYGRVAPRSGLAVKHGISTGAGVIDADYRGEVKVVLFNHSDKDFPINAGDRIAQLVLEKIINADIEEITAEQLDSTERGEGGFGSTGKN